MKKKLIVTLFAVLLVVALATVCFACSPAGDDNDSNNGQNNGQNNNPNDDQNNSQNNNQDILSLCDGLSDAKSATQVITVKKGGNEIAKETLGYNFVTGKVSIERKTLNTSDADELYSTETETKDITGGPTAKLTKDLLKDVTETATTLNAKVANANISEVFNIQSSDVTGDAKVELTAQNNRIVSITATYTSSNGNAVEIVTTYVY